MKSRLVLVTLAFFFITTLAEARLGSGRSSGFRGNRGFRSRPAPTAPYRNEASRPANPSPLGAGAPYPQAPQRSWGGGIMGGLVAGLAGGLLGSMLFRGTGLAGPGGMAGGGGIGLLEILLIAAVGFFLFRWLRNRSASQSPAYASGQPRATVYDEPPAYAPIGLGQEPPEGEDAASESLRRYDGAFDLKRFKDARLDDFFALQAAFANRDLGSVRERVAPELFSALEGDVSRLRAEHRINKLENIAVRDATLVEGWQELGKEFATVRVTANVVDYTVDDRTGDLVAGSKTEPVKFDEYWTYVRDIGFAAQSTQWRLSAIEQTGSGNA